MHRFVTSTPTDGYGGLNLSRIGYGCPTRRREFTMIDTTTTRRLLATGAFTFGAMFLVACSDEDGDGAETDEEIGEVENEVDEAEDQVETEVDEAEDELED